MKTRTLDITLRVTVTGEQDYDYDSYDDPIDLDLNPTGRAWGSWDVSTIEIGGEGGRQLQRLGIPTVFTVPPCESDTPLPLISVWCAVGICGSHIAGDVATAQDAWSIDEDLPDEEDEDEDEDGSHQVEVEESVKLSEPESESRPRLALVTT